MDFDAILEYKPKNLEEIQGEEARTKELSEREAREAEPARKRPHREWGPAQAMRVSCGGLDAAVSFLCCAGQEEEEEEDNDDDETAAALRALENDNAPVVEFTATEMKKLAISLQRKVPHIPHSCNTSCERVSRNPTRYPDAQVKKNQELRIKFPDEPLK